MPIEKLYERVGSMYKLVNLASRRAQELSEGAPKLVEGGVKKKSSIIALREILEDKIGIEIKESKQSAKKTVSKQ